MGLLQSIFRFLGVLSPLHIRLVTLFSRAECVGVDGYGNQYFRADARKGYSLERRWVLYAKTPDASCVPAEWHGWLHHQTKDCPATKQQTYRRPWQKTHQGNESGTDKAHLPPGHLLQGGKRASVSADYTPWSPSSSQKK